MPAPAERYRKYLDPKVLARIGRLELRARLIVEGFFSGMHRSPYRGLSIEFADHRAYTQGDDTRHIDWKVFGKTDKYYIKEYEQETNLQLVLVVDGSESMSYGSEDGALTKHEYATAIAAAIAYLALHRRDAVGVAHFDDRLRQFIRPSNHTQQWKTIIDELEGKTGPAKTSIAKVCAELSDRLAQRSLIMILSDLFDDVPSVLKGLSQLRYRRHEVVVAGVWDHAELTLPFRGLTMFEGLEAGDKLLAEPGGLRERYLEEVRRFQTALQRGCADAQIEYAPFDTSQPLDAALSTYLATRSARLRQRSSRVLTRG